MTDFINENTESDDNEDDDEGSDSDSTEKQSGNDWSNFFGGGDFDMSNIPNMGDFDMSQMPNMGDFDPSSMPDTGNFNPSNIPNMGDFDMSSIPGFGENNGLNNGEGVSNENNTSDGDSKSGKTSPRQGGFGGFGGFGGGFGMGSDDVKLKYIDDDIDSYSNIFNNAKTTVNKTDKNRLISSLKALSEQSDIENTVDVDEVIRYFVVHNFLCNGDSYTGSMIHNYYLYEKDGQLSMIPWDYNLAYGSFTGGNASSSVNAAIDTPVSGDMSDRPMISWIFDIEEYTEMYHEYFQEFLNSVDWTKMIEDTAALIDEYVEKDPTKFCTYEDFLKGVEAIKQFCELRAESVQGQLDGTIPSTSSGQSADSSALIDVNGLNTSDMGSMGGGAGGGFGGGDRGGFSRDNTDRGTGRPQDTETTEDNGNTETASITASNMSYSSTEVIAMETSSTDSNGDNSQGGFGGGMPGGFGGSMPSGDMPEGFDPSQFGGNMPNGSVPDGFDPSQFGGSMPEGFDSSQFGGERPSSGKTGSSDRSSSDRSSFGQNSFSGFSGTAAGDESTEYILLGASAGILLIGLLFAILFKRRK
ncbi:MAG: CotH kinase family protein [Lachnospiraceae bacterium]|nr:CotH kinase family protein [Lachnospiraceae bacterium]